MDLKDLYLGATKHVTISKNELCPECHGTGGKLGKTKQCNLCNGKGVVIQQVNSGMGYYFNVQNVCPRCSGKGIVFILLRPFLRHALTVEE